jgi:hypothetical protein
MPNHNLLVPPRKQLLTLLLLPFIRNVLKKVDDGVIHLAKVHAVVFNAPGWRI